MRLRRNEPIEMDSELTQMTEIADEILKVTCQRKYGQKTDFLHLLFLSSLYNIDNSVVFIKYA